MKKFIFVSTILIFLGITHTALAASAVISAPSSAKVGETFEVQINIDTGGELINSVDFSLEYDENLLSFAGYKDENGIIKFWIKTPKEEAGTINFSGIIPGGASVLYDPNQKDPSPLPVASIIFEAKAEGEAEFYFTKSSILKHDGKGTPLLHEDFSAKSVIGVGGEKLNSSIDKTPPLPFVVTLVKSSFFSRTPSMLIFEAKDLDSGIKKYQIKIGGGAWRDVQSPAPISKSIFSQNVIVKAVDFSDNTREESIGVPGLVPVKVLIILAIILCGILGIKLLKYRA